MSVHAFCAYAWARVCRCLCAHGSFLCVYVCVYEAREGGSLDRTGRAFNYMPWPPCLEIPFVMNFSLSEPSLSLALALALALSLSLARARARSLSLPLSLTVARSFAHAVAYGSVRLLV